MYEVFKILSDYIGKIKVYSPDTFKKVLLEEDNSFNNIHATDPKDLILFLLKKIHEENNDRSKSNIPNYNFSYNANPYNSS